MQNIVTLNLTVPALERLFEGDPDIVLELRKGAMAQFAKLKIVNVLDAATKVIIEEEVKKHVGEVKGYPPNVNVAPEVLANIKQEAVSAIAPVRKEIETLIRQTVSEQLAAMQSSIKALVEQRVTYEVKEQIKKEVGIRLAKMIEAGKG